MEGGDWAARSHCVVGNMCLATVVGWLEWEWEWKGWNRRGLRGQKGIGLDGWLGQVGGEHLDFGMFWIGIGIWEMTWVLFSSSSSSASVWSFLEAD